MKRYLILFLFLMSTGILFSVQAIQGENSFLDLKPDEFYRLLQSTPDSDRQLIDVRTVREYTAGHLKNAELLDYRSFDFVRQMKAKDREKIYFIYCRSGNRSSRAVQVMKELGFKKVINLQGGTIGWHKRGLPFVR